MREVAPPPATEPLAPPSSTDEPPGADGIPHQLGPEDGAERVERGFVCRSCGAASHGRYIPEGWYVLQRALQVGEPHRRLGLFCTLPCLMRSHRRLEEGAAEHGARLGLPEDDLEDRARLVKRALAHLHDGMTVRQAGDRLGIPTRTLHGWLSRAGISTNEAGTLSTITETARLRAQFTREQLHERQHNLHPVSVAHELQQISILADLAWSQTATGPSHQPHYVFTLTATYVPAATRLSGQGQAGSKATARAHAATQLLTALEALLE